MTQSTLTDSEKGVLLDLYHRCTGQYQRPWLVYHNWTHLNTMFDYVKTKHPDLDQDFCMNAAILMHDFIYEPGADDNESRSAELFEQFVKETLRKHPEFDIPSEKIDWSILSLLHMTRVYAKI